MARAWRGALLPNHVSADLLWCARHSDRRVGVELLGKLTLRKR